MIKKKQAAAVLAAVAVMCQPANMAEAMTSSEMKQEISIDKKEVRELTKKIKRVKAKIQAKEDSLDYVEALIDRHRYGCMAACSGATDTAVVAPGQGRDAAPLAEGGAQAASFLSGLRYIGHLPSKPDAEAQGPMGRLAECQETINALEGQRDALHSEISGHKKDLDGKKDRKKELTVTIKANRKRLAKLISKEKTSFDGVALKYSAVYRTGARRLTKRLGRVYYNGHKETYYSQRVLPGGALKIPGRHVADDGTVRDRYGYICVAANQSFMGKGTKLMTSLGPAKVYDTGCPGNTIDIYVNW